MSIFFAVLFTLICWLAGVLFLINFGLATPQYGSDKYKRKYNIFFVSGLVVLFVALPGLGIYLTL